MLLFCERLCKSICRHLIGRHVVKVDMIRSNLLANVVVLDINVFRLLMILRVLSEVKGALIVSIHLERAQIRARIA